MTNDPNQNDGDHDSLDEFCFPQFDLSEKNPREKQETVDVQMKYLLKSQAVKIFERQQGLHSILEDSESDNSEVDLPSSTTFEKPKILLSKHTIS